MMACTREARNLALLLAEWQRCNAACAWVLDAGMLVLYKASAWHGILSGKGTSHTARDWPTHPVMRASPVRHLRPCSSGFTLRQAWYSSGPAFL